MGWPLRASTLLSSSTVAIAPPPTPRISLLRSARLPRSWFARDALSLARLLIGCRLVYERNGHGPPLVARIVETEAYRGPKDRASHARVGLTARTRSLLGEEGRAYVFFVYGLHDCFNVTCGGAGSGHAVLIRAGEPTAGFEPKARLDGPGRFARALGISRAENGKDLTAPPLYFCGREKRPRVACSARVGVAYAGEWADKPWRFYDPTSRHVSRPPKKSIGR